MASTTNENYITETILVSLYNRSAGLRKLISGQFGTKVDFGSSIRFTGNNRKNSKDNKYGCPDATSNLGNYIEVKVNSTPLTDHEKKGGMEGKGYERFLNENPSNYLLYIIPDYYDGDFVESDRAKILKWSKILDYIFEQNEYDPFISIIYSKVEGIKEKEIRTFSSYKAKIYESLIKVMEKLPELKIILNNEEESSITIFPDQMEDEDFNFINFNYHGKSKEQYYFYFERDGIALYLPQEFNSFCGSYKGFALVDNWLKMEIMSQKEFWKFSTDEITQRMVKQLKLFLESYEKIENDIENCSKIYEDVFVPALAQFAEEKKLKFEKDKDLMTFYFQKGNEKWWYAFQFEQPNWRDFRYGIFYEGSKKQRVKFEKVLENSLDDEGNWTTYKYFEFPYINWEINVFEEIKTNSRKFIEKHISQKLKEINKALEL